MAKVKKKSTKKKNDESSIYSGVAINIADDCTMIRKRKTNRKINFSLSR